MISLFLRPPPFDPNGRLLGRLLSGPSIRSRAPRADNHQVIVVLWARFVLTLRTTVRHDVGRSWNHDKIGLNSGTVGRDDAAQREAGYVLFSRPVATVRCVVLRRSTLRIDENLRACGPAARRAGVPRARWAFFPHREYRGSAGG